MNSGRSREPVLSDSSSQALGRLSYLTETKLIIKFKTYYINSGRLREPEIFDSRITMSSVVRSSLNLRYKPVWSNLGYCMFKARREPQSKC